MRREDIDKKIGMPDVDAEWAKFEREVINPKTTSRKPFYWGIGIAASIALIAGIFLLGQVTKDPQTIAQQNTPAKKKTSAEAKAIEEPKDLSEKDVTPIVETKQRPSSDLLAQVSHPTTEGKVDDEQQGRIAGLTIVSTSEDLGSGNTMRLRGVRVAGKDSVIIGRKIDYDFLVVVNGKPLSEAEQKQMLSSDFNVYFVHRQQLINSIYVYKDEDNKRPYVEQYGERAKNAVMVITTVPDTLCDAYVQQHPELMQTRHRVEGYVIDNDTEKPLPDAWIHYWDSARAATDSTGHFVLWLPQKDAKLQVSHTGFITVRINRPADTMLTIRMKPATKLKDVKVTQKNPGSQVYNPNGIQTTSVDDASLSNEQFYNVYDLNGVKVLDHARSLDSLQPGVYIINGKKQTIKQRR